MKMKSTVLLLVAGGFGLVAMLGVMQALKGKGPEPTVRVLVAKGDIPSGMPLDDTNVMFKEMPQKAVPSGAVTTPEEYAGKCLITRAVPGEIIMAAKLGGAEAITASHQIPKGMRVTTVSVDATKSHSGLIRPTDRVDVVCTYEVYTAGNRSKSKRVKTVLEYIAVFAVDAVRAGREGEVDGVIKNVSLLVDPEQFQLLKAAEQMGELALSLRNRDDKERTDVPELTDSIFTQRDVSEGARDAVETPAAGGVVQKSNLAEFLTSTVTAMAEAATTPATAAAPPTWTMTICKGDSITDVVVLDEQALPRHLTPTERQEMQAEVRDRVESVKKSQKSNEAEPGSDSGNSQPDEGTAPASENSKPAGPPSPSSQASATPAAPPALLPSLPYQE
ncbi:MAG: Flp pilus assembly protein CpaB [Planctomycetaceae bacterium]